MKPGTTKLSLLSRLFSSAVIKELASRGCSPLFARLIRNTEVGSQISQASATVASAFDAAFAMLQVAGTRDEYIYRSALTQKILLGRHSLHTATMLSEFRVVTSRADLAILNGTSTAYEIKSDRDSLSRLHVQMENYRKVFASVYVIAGDLHLSRVLNCIPADVGVMRLARWNRVSVIKPAIDNPYRVCPLAILDSLRSVEAKKILSNIGIHTPSVPNTELRATLRHHFRQLDPVTVHKEMVKVLKETRAQFSSRALIDQLPSSLQAAALSIPLRKRDHDRLVAAILTPLDVATIWE